MEPDDDALHSIKPNGLDWSWRDASPHSPEPLVGLMSAAIFFSDRYGEGEGNPPDHYVTCLVEWMDDEPEAWVIG